MNWNLATIVGVDGVIGPAVAAGGRLGAALLRRPKLKRKASLTVEASAFINGAVSNIELILENSRRNLDAVTVTNIVPMLQVHDQSCGEPEFVTTRKGLHGEYPRCPLPVEPGESVKWHARVHIRDIHDEHKRLVAEAMRRTWGESGYGELLEMEKSQQDARSKKKRTSKVARLLDALDEPAPRMLFLVETKHDGQYKSGLLRPTQTPMLDRLKAAWVQ